MKYIEDFASFWEQIRTITRDILSTNIKKSRAILVSKTIISLLPLIQIYLIKTLIDQITLQKNSSSNQLIIILVSFGIMQLLISFFSQFTNNWESSLQLEVSDHFANKIIDKTSKLEYSSLEDPTLQNNLYLAQQQARLRVNQLLPSIYNSFSAALSILFLVIFFIGLEAYFFLFVLFLAVPITFHKWRIGKKTTDLEFKLAPKERESNYLFQVLTGLPWSKEIRTFGFAIPFQTRFQKIRKWIATEKNKIQQDGIKQGLFIEILEVGASVVILLYLALNTLDSKISFGLFILYLQGIQRLQTTSKTFFQSLLQLFQLRTFLKDLYSFLALPEKEKQTEPSTNINEIIIDNVTFSYPNTKSQALKNINLFAQKGEVVAIVGENGSGKSTLVKLLGGLYSPLSGKILINGENVNIGSGSILYQDFQQYQYSAESNIHFLLNAAESETEKARIAAEISTADEFIQKLARGYQTNLGNLFEESTQLSGGQWQKLALSRIFYRKKDLIVLDEPSSALDAFAELDLYEKIKKEFKESIVILISHRLYNLKMADRIYVMHEGQVVDEGNFKELINRDGIFKSMYEKQKI